MRLSRLLIATVLALAIALVYISNVFGQTTYPRHALIEEGTGTWCQWCAYGGWDMDSIEHKLGSNLVAISWHGPAGYSEPFWLPQSDTFQAYSGSTGYPFAVVGRQVMYSGAPTPPGINNYWYLAAVNQAQQAPMVDFRIVNAVYSSGTQSVDFDVDVTPLTLSGMPTEDTVNYVLVAAITEDGIVEPQATADAYGTNGGQEWSTDNYVHHNVARKAISKLLGDVIKIGTKTAVAWPVRKHYHVSVSNSEWVRDSLKVKAFACWQSKKYGIEPYLDAGQTNFITKLPSLVAPSIWTVLPEGNLTISPTGTTPIVWGTGGGAATNAKLEYSLDNGTTWNLIAASVPSMSNPPYQWTIPDSLFGMSSVIVRVSDASNASITSMTPSFAIPVKSRFDVSVDSTIAGATTDTLWVGEPMQINWTAYGGSESVKIEYSTNGTTWTPIKNVTSGTSLNWTVPAAAKAAAVRIRVSDAGGVSGVSAPFAVVPVGTISNVTFDGGTTFLPNSQVTVHWTSQGYLGKALKVLVYNIDASTWIAIATQVDPAQTQATVTLPAWEATATKFQVLAQDNAADSSSTFNISASAGVEPSIEANSISVSPDPVVSAAHLNLTLDAPLPVSLELRDLLGREVMHSSLGTLSVGVQAIPLDLSNLVNGTYEYLLHLGTKTFSGRIVVAR